MEEKCRTQFPNLLITPSKPFLCKTCLTFHHQTWICEVSVIRVPKKFKSNIELHCKVNCKTEGIWCKILWASIRVGFNPKTLIHCLAHHTSCMIHWLIEVCRRNSEGCKPSCWIAIMAVYNLITVWTAAT